MEADNAACAMRSYSVLTSPTYSHLANFIQTFKMFSFSRRHMTVVFHFLLTAFCFQETITQLYRVWLIRLLALKVGRVSDTRQTDSG